MYSVRDVGRQRPDEERKRMMRRWTSGCILEKPVCDRSFNPKKRAGVVRYPSDSSVFTPFVDEETIKG